MSFDDGQTQDMDPSSSIEGVLNSVKRMVDTLDQVHVCVCALCGTAGIIQ